MVFTSSIFFNPIFRQLQNRANTQKLWVRRQQEEHVFACVQLQQLRQRAAAARVRVQRVQCVAMVSAAAVFVQLPRILACIGGRLRNGNGRWRFRCHFPMKFGEVC